MGQEKHEIVYHNNDYYVCVYDEEKEDKCCCLSFSKLFEFKKDANNKLFLVSLVDTEYLNAIISFSASHPDMAIIFLCPNNTLCIKLIEFKSIYPDENKDDENIKNKIAHAIERQLVGFSDLIEKRIIEPYKVKKKISNIEKKFFLAVPKDSIANVNSIVKDTLRSTTYYNLVKHGQLEIVPCEALETSCNKKG